MLTGYLQKFPSSSFAGDCWYRIAVCKYSAEQYAEVIKDCREWLKDFMETRKNGCSGDALVTEGKLEEAIKVYQRSYRIAATDEACGIGDSLEWP